MIDSSDAHVAENHLRERFGTLAFVADTLPVNIAYCDANTKYRFVNRAYAERFGKTQDECVGKRIPEVVGEAAYGNFRHHVERALSGERVEFETEIHYAFGKRYVHAEYVPERNANGLVTGFVAAIYDITKLKESENELRKTQQQLELAHGVADVGIWNHDLATDVLWLDERAKKHYGLDTDITTFAEVFKRLHPDDVQRLGEEFGAATGPDANGSFATEYRIIHTDGTVHWLSVGVKVWFDGEGKDRKATVGFGTTQDITKRKNTEEQLRFLVELNQAMTAIVEPDAIMSTTARMLGEHLRVNRCAYAEVIANEDDFNLFGDYTRDTFSIVGTYKMSQFGDDVHRKMLANEPYVVDDVWNDPRTAGFRESYIQTDIAAVICLPLHKDGKFVAAMAVHQKTPRRWSSHEVELTQLVVNRCWEALERARTANGLRMSEQRWHLASSAANMFAWEVNFKTKIINWSENAAHVIGCEPSDLPTDESQALFFVAPVERERLYAELNNNFSDSKRLFSFSFQGLRGQIWEAQGTVVYDADGNPERLIGVTHEVTERKHAEQALRRNEEKYRSLFNSIDEGFCVVEVMFDAESKPIDYKFVDINPMFESQTGLVDAKGKTARALLPDLEQRWFDVYGSVALTGKPVRFVEGSDVMNRWFDVNAFRVGEAHERQVAILFTDITERRQVQQQIIESEQRFRDMADGAPVMVWVTDANGHCTYLNRLWYEFTGQTPEEAQGLGWLNALHPDDVERAGQNFLSSNAKQEPFQEEYRLRSRNGEYRWAIDSAKPRFAADGEYLGYVGSVVDIMERKMMEQVLEQRVNERTYQLAESNRNLERSNEDLEQFAYIASHDLQEPLRKIKTFADRLYAKASPLLDDANQTYLKKIIGSADRMNALIQDVLEYSKLTSLSEYVVPTDLNGVLKNVLTDFELTVEQKKADVRTDVLPTVEAAPLQMNQLFTNLVSNSLKFSAPDRTPLLDITSRMLSNEEALQYGLQRGLRYCEIVFKDNGIGFSPEYAEQIFIIFQRLHGKHSFAGTGIGLALCRKIVSNHHGIIVAESQEGEGAAFRIVLPLIQPKHSVA